MINFFNTLNMNNISSMTREKIREAMEDDDLMEELITKTQIHAIGDYFNQATKENVDPEE